MKKVIFSVLLLTASQCIAQRQGYYDSVVRHFNYLINKDFAILELEDTSGRLINTTSLVGKTIYVDFWFTSCAPCLKEIPQSKALQQCFANDTSVVFLNICIENLEKKAAWKQMVKDKQMSGLHLFYTRNRPQKINLLREYRITFPTYLLVNSQRKIVGYDAPRPSEAGWVHWAIASAKEGKTLATAFFDVYNDSPKYKSFKERLASCLPMKITLIGDAVTTQPTF